MANKVNLARWRKHLKRATARGITLAQYAREHGLSRHTLCAASQQQRAEAVAERIEAQPGLQRKGKASRSAFIAVRLPEAQSAPERAGEQIGSKGTTVLQARLPNGVQISIEVSGIEAGVIETGAARPSQVPQGPQGSQASPASPGAPGAQGASTQALWAQILQALAGLPCSR